MDVSHSNSNELLALPNDLIGKFRQIGNIGPAYEILGPGPEHNGRPFARILLIESGEETSYPIAEILTDPEPV